MYPLHERKNRQIELSS
ncbi:BgTH12-05997 [Blumeria graminis f. sp. triticale]|uniref:Bgt-51765 n=2 Tax=Blumeria graminis TaxID=34373 RepID=A0A9X9QEJ1_BLUGR|nr:BgTH12-05997 [Blumeria graminis f. sp. triticale]VDB91074.1 Bgt-51765 [Blumeria graminis f. sp. tritici]